MSRSLILLWFVCFVSNAYAGFPAFSLPQHAQFKNQGAEGADDSGSGNWYEKLHWWREAKRLYTIDIQAAMDHLKSIARSYDEKKKIFFEQLDKARKTLPVLAPQALPRIKVLLQELAAQQEQDPEDNEVLTKQYNKLESLQKSFEHFSILSQRVEEAYVKVLLNQIKSAERYEEKALENFEKIENVFDDRKAHGYYQVVENSLENIRALIEYLAGPFYIFTEQVSARVLQLAPVIKASLTELEQEGIYVRVVSEKEKAEKEAAEKKQELRSKEVAQKKAATQKNQSWWSSVTTAAGEFWDSLGGLFSSDSPKTTARKPVPPSKNPAPVPSAPKQALPKNPSA